LKAKHVRVCTLACLSFLLWGCSSASFFYNRLDFFLPWYVDGYTDLNAEQESFLDERLQPFLDWHRGSELPCYVALIDQAEAALAEDLTQEEITTLSRRFELAWYRTQEEALDWLLELGEQLDDGQIEKFLEETREKQAEYEKEYLERSDAEFVEDSYERMVDTSQDYLGRLQKEQRAVLRTASEKLTRSDTLWLAERAKFIAALEGLLAREPGWQQQVQDLIAAQSQAPSPQYQQVLDHNLDIMQQATAEIVNTRTAKQDKHLRDELQDLRGELHQLAAAASQPGSCEAEFLQASSEGAL
jgi:hypothetical protein